MKCWRAERKVGDTWQPHSDFCDEKTARVEWENLMLKKLTKKHEFRLLDPKDKVVETTEKKQYIRVRQR